MAGRPVIISNITSSVPQDSGVAGRPVIISNITSSVPQDSGLRTKGLTPYQKIFLKYTHQSMDIPI